MSDRRSKAITEGDIRAPNRSMLRAVGFDDAAFQKSIVGVANAYSNLTPCNAGIATLADRAMAALREAGRDAPGLRHDHRQPTASRWAPRA